MSYSVQEVNGCTKKLLFKIEKLDLTSEIKTALLKKQKEANIKGFRKGKAPLGMVEKVYGSQVETDALNSFIQTQLYDAITKEDLKVVGYPTFENMKYDQGKSISFDALVEVFPEVKLNKVKGLSFAKDTTEVTDKDIEDLKKNYLGSKADLVESKDTELKKGHYAVINFEGEMPDGSKPDNMKGSEYLLEIGSNQFIPGFEDGITGLKTGESKLLELEFPKDYHVDELKGARVKFDVKLLEIKEKKLPEFTDEFAKEVGYESVEDFTNKSRETLKHQKERASQHKLQQDILGKLIEENPFDIPYALVHKQEQYVKEDLERNLKQQGFNDEMVQEYFGRWTKDITEKASFQVRSGLILDKLANDYKVDVTEKDIESKLEEMATQSKIELDKLKGYYLSNQNLKRNLEYSLREEKTFESLLKDLKVS